MEIDIAKGTSNCKVLRIKTYPHLKKFIKKFYKLNNDGSVRVDAHTSLGMVMSKVLLSKEKLRSDHLERFSDEIDLSLSKRLSEYSLQPRIVYQFNIEMDRLFKEHMIEWILSQYSTGTITVSDAIRNFQKKYGINEGDYSFDNMFRQYTRWTNDEYERRRSRCIN